MCGCFSSCAKHYIGRHTITCSWPCEKAIVVEKKGVTVKNCIINFKYH